MSTRVVPEEYGTLEDVPPQNYHSDQRRGKWFNPILGLCNVQPSHGSARHMMQTPDHRSIEFCGSCYIEILKSQKKRNEL